MRARCVQRTRWTAIAALAIGVCIGAFLVPGAALAFDETIGDMQHHGELPCGRCHRDPNGGPLDCNFGGCHFAPNETAGKGPHGVYSSTTRRCSMCHGVHATVGAKLLPKTTVTGTCYSCHDGTGGRGVYGAIKARTGSDPPGIHRVDTTSTVPGGNGATGGPSTMAFKGPNGTLGCDDCHSPHDTASKVVAAYRVSRMRTWYDDKNVSAHPGLLLVDKATTHLLLRNPGGSVTTATVYGADWCRACHAGRASGGAPHNHPVDSLLSTTTPFTYSNVALLASDDPTATTVFGALAETNRGYLMPYPRTSQQGAHKPICQQCHGNTADVGSLSADGTLGDAQPSVITTPDGVALTDNPRFQNFPHETANDYLLVETDDNLCLNCHPPAGLP